MIAADMAVAVLLALAVMICAISGIAVVVMPGFYNKIHFLAPPAVLATAAVAAALLLGRGFSGSGMKALLILLVMVISNPVVTHAAARAKRIREAQHHEREGIY